MGEDAGPWPIRVSPRMSSREQNALVRDQVEVINHFDVGVIPEPKDRVRGKTLAV